MLGTGSEQTTVPKHEDMVTTSYRHTPLSGPLVVVHTPPPPSHQLPGTAPEGPPPGVPWLLGHPSLSRALREATWHQGALLAPQRGLQETWQMSDGVPA